MSKRTRHRTSLEDRGPEHQHRWLGRCTCGWEGVPVNLRDTARAQVQRHLTVVGVWAERGRRRAVAPRPVTPPDQLPEALR